MDYRAILDAVLGLVDEMRVGILTTVDERGRPRSRWMTPTVLSRLPGALYAVSSREFVKTRHIQSDPNVSWIFQSRTLDRIGTIRGRARIVEEPGLTAEVLEAIGPRLNVFWRYNGDPKNLVVVETTIDAVSIFHPLGDGLHEAEVDDGEG